LTLVLRPKLSCDTSIIAPMPKPLHIWITGASRGIGAAAAKLLTESHHRVSLSARNEASLVQVESMLTGGSAAVVPCDVAAPNSVRDAHAEAVALFGPIDVLINSAGIGIWKDLVKMSIEEFDDQIDINLRGAFLCSKVVLPSMIDRRRGMIINVNSVASLTSFSGNSAYAASKAGHLAMSRALREEVREHGIKITDLMVGATETDIWSDAAREEFAERMMSVDDIAEVIGDVVAGFDNPRRHIEEMVIRPQRGDL